jgi:predicted transport protein
MKIFSINNSNFKEIYENQFKLEREIQELFESNLNKIMGLTLVKSEFTIKNKRIDTLAFDEQANAFIIIEYKRDKNISVVDQGFTYLSLMLENKADFIIEYNEQLKKSLKRDDVDWSQTRVAFVSPSFTENQIQATNFKDIAIELWEIKRYDNNTIVVNSIKKSRGAESIKPLAQKNNELRRVTDEIAVYSEDEHIKYANDEIKELYEKFRAGIINLDSDIEIKPQKFYIAFKKNNNIACLELQKNQLKIFIGIKKGGLNDGKNIAKDVSNIGHYGTGDYQIIVKDDEQLEYILSLIKQAITISN